MLTVKPLSLQYSNIILILITMVIENHNTILAGLGLKQFYKNEHSKHKIEIIK